MAPNPRRLDAKLQELYDRIPEIPDCKGLCSDSCGPIRPTTSIREVDRMERAAGHPLRPDMGPAKLMGRGICESQMCSFLTDEGRCSVYDLRPMICRLWGASEDLKCPYGCVPEGGWLTADEGMALLVEALVIGGTTREQDEMANDRVLALLRDPDARKKLLAAPRQWTLGGRRKSRPTKPVIER